jgi:hypothetical protein
VISTAWAATPVVCEAGAAIWLVGMTYPTSRSSFSIAATRSPSLASSAAVCC